MTQLLMNIVTNRQQIHPIFPPIMLQMPIHFPCTIVERDLEFINAEPLCLTTQQNDDLQIYGPTLIYLICLVCLIMAL